jgi:hypothetical protein
MNWTAIVGICGIVGSVLTGYLTNRDAEKRLRLQQEYEDRRRFHKERADLYGKLLGLCQTVRVRNFQARIEARHSPDKSTPESLWAPLMTAMTDFSATAKTVAFLGAPATRDAASKLLSVLSALFGLPRDAEDSKYEDLNQKLRDAESAFADAARAELLSEEVAAKHAVPK